MSGHKDRNQRGLDFTQAKDTYDLRTQNQHPYAKQQPLNTFYNKQKTSAQRNSNLASELQGAQAVMVTGSNERDKLVNGVGAKSGSQSNNQRSFFENFQDPRTANSGGRSEVRHTTLP